MDDDDDGDDYVKGSVILKNNHEDAQENTKEEGRGEKVYNKVSN